MGYSSIDFIVRGEIVVMFYSKKSFSRKDFKKYGAGKMIII